MENGSEGLTEKNIQKAQEFIELNPFACLITLDANTPLFSHVPLIPKKTETGFEVSGHLARANPQWRTFSSSKAWVIFQGPHTYITPKWYAQNDVPTWNYVSLEISGRLEVVEDSRTIIGSLEELSGHIERRWSSGWKFFVPEDLSGERLAKSIIGFRISADRIIFRRKLSQNKKAADRAGILRGLSKRNDDNSREILAEMQKLYTTEGEMKK